MNEERISMYEITLQLPFNGFQVKGQISLPVQATSLIIFSPGFKNSNFRNSVSLFTQKFQEAGFGILRYDGFHQYEDWPNVYKDIGFLSQGIETSIKWLHQHSEYCSMDLAFFARDSTSAIALKAAISLSKSIKTIVTLGECPDFTELQKSQLTCPILMITDDGSNHEGMTTNKKSSQDLSPEKKLVEIAGGFDDPAKISEATRHMVRWYQKHLSHHAQSILA